MQPAAQAPVTNLGNDANGNPRRARRQDRAHLEYDEAKVPPYTLPDRSCSRTARRSRDAGTWGRQRRPRSSDVREGDLRAGSASAPEGHVAGHRHRAGAARARSIKRVIGTLGEAATAAAHPADALHAGEAKGRVRLLLVNFGGGAPEPGSRAANRASRRSRPTSWPAAGLRNDLLPGHSDRSQDEPGRRSHRVSARRPDAGSGRLGRDLRRAWGASRAIDYLEPMPR